VAIVALVSSGCSGDSSSPPSTPATTPPPIPSTTTTPPSTVADIVTPFPDGINGPVVPGSTGPASR